MDAILGKLAYLLGNAIVIFVLTAVAALVFREKFAPRVLEKDNAGWFFFATSVVVAIVGSLLQENLGTWFLTLGGFLMGVGLLIALPEKATAWLLSWRNILGVALLVVGGYAVWVYILVPLEPAAKEVWAVITKYYDVSFLLGLVGVVGIFLGLIFVFGKRKI